MIEIGLSEVVTAWIYRFNIGIIRVTYLFVMISRAFLVIDRDITQLIGTAAGVWLRHHWGYYSDVEKWIATLDIKKKPTGSFSPVIRILRSPAGSRSGNSGEVRRVIQEKEFRHFSMNYPW